ncbi:MAG: hypothetical protein JWQ53_1701 [Klenkia sp.]|nr:hypothetical protein [Klenkia sp.]
MATDGVEHVLRVNARPESLEQVHELLAALWADDAMPTLDRMHFDTAVAEVAANIVEHATRGQDVTLVLRVSGWPDRVEARFEDDGAEAHVDLAAAAMPGSGDPDDLDAVLALAEDGRGLALARAAVDELVYEREGSTNRWFLVRRRSR